MAENTKELLEFLSYQQLRAIWAEYKEQNPELQKTCSNKRSYIINISRLLDEEKYNHFVIEEDNGEFTFRFNSDADSENSEDEKLAELVETKVSIAHPPESKEKKEESKNVYSDKPPETISTRLLSFRRARAVSVANTNTNTNQIRSSNNPPSSPRGEPFDAESADPLFWQTAEAQESSQALHTKLESESFRTADVEAAGIYFDPKAIASEHLTRFPWIIFNTDEIPVLPSHSKLFTAPPKLVNLQPQPSPIKVVKKDATYTTTEKNWSFKHVLNDAWEHYFSSLNTKFWDDQEGEVMTEEAISSIVKQFCAGFGHSQQAQHDLRQYPKFNLLHNRQDQVTVKPDLSAGYFKLTEDHKVNLLVNSTPETEPLNAIKEMLDTVLSWKLWDPRVASVVLPCLVAEFKKDSDHYEDVSKLLIEMAMVRDTRDRLFATQTRHTLGIYVCKNVWRFYALRDVPPAETDSGQVNPVPTAKPVFKYEAYLLHQFTLEYNELSWFRLGVIMWRLAAYNLSRLLKCKVKDKTQLDKLHEELQEYSVQKIMAKASSKKEVEDKKKTKKGNKEDCKPKEDKKGKDDTTDNDDGDKEPKKRDTIKRRLDQPQVVQRTSTTSKGGHSGQSGEKKRRLTGWLPDIQSKIYSNSRTTVSICIMNGKEMVLKEIRSGNGTHEVHMLCKLQGPGVVKLYHADRTTDHTRIFLEKLNPLPDFTTYNDLCHFMRGLFAGLMWIHKNNCVHGDIKPQNVMMSKKNDVKIIDFGRARYLYGNTYAYMAPEILLGEPQTNKIDIFAAGLVCAEKMLGIRIESFDSRNNLIDKVFDGEMSHLATESGLDLLSSMLCTDPDERPTAEACLDHPFLSGEYESMDESY